MIIKAVLLDLDGLLVDSEPLHLKAWRQVADQNGWGAATNEELASFVGKGAITLAEHIKQKSGSEKSAQELYDQKTKLYLSQVRSITLMPGVKEFLMKLRRNHLRLAVVSSSKRQEAVQALQFAGIFSFFDCVITGEDVKNLKPAPDAYLLACKKLNIHPGEAIAFEDSATGVSAAKSATIFCIAVPNIHTQTQSFKKADLTIDSIDILLGEHYGKIKTRNPLVGKLLG